MAITITEAGVKALRRIIDEQKTAQNTQSELGLRVMIRGGGCSGMTQQLALDTAPNPDDQVMEHQGIKIFCDAKSYLYLNGAEVDYKEDPFNSGFTLNNPQVKHSCGCGKSFSV